MRKVHCIALLCWGLAVVGHAAESGNIFGISLPRSIDEMFETAHEDPDAGFRFQKGYSALFFQGIRHYDDPRLGYSLAYAAVNDIRISVYVFDLGMDDIPDGTDSAQVRDELARSDQELSASGQYAGVEVRTAAGQLSPHFAQSSHTISITAEQTVCSYPFVWDKNGYFVNLRVPGSAGMEPHLIAFLADLAADLGIEWAVETAAE